MGMFSYMCIICMSCGIAFFKVPPFFVLCISMWTPCSVSAQRKSICLVGHIVSVVVAAIPHQCPLKPPNYLIMSLFDNIAINAGVSVEAANHLSLFLTTPGTTATSNQILHKIVIVDQVGFHLVPSLSKKCLALQAMCVGKHGTIAFHQQIPAYSTEPPLCHPCATPVPPLCHPCATLVPPFVPPLCHPCATPVLVMLASIMQRLTH